MTNLNSIFRIFPNRIYQEINKYLMSTDSNIVSNLEEIRFRTNRPIILKTSLAESVLNYIVTSEDMIEILSILCENSIYSYQSQICSGFITIKGGHRVGIVGSTIIKEGKITNINYISGLNFRIARQVVGCSNKLLKYVLDMENNTIFNTLLVSSPGSGKTTLLRDFIRRISNGIEGTSFKGVTVGVVDERGEIAAMYKGIAQNDLGLRTDVLDNTPKAIGMNLLIRSMSPNVIAADEIGSKDDIEAIEYAVCSGIKGIFTAHGSNMEDVRINPSLAKLLNSGVIERIVFLSNNKQTRGDISKVYGYNKMNSIYEIIK